MDFDLQEFRIILAKQLSHEDCKCALKPPVFFKCEMWFWSATSSQVTVTISSFARVTKRASDRPLYLGQQLLVSQNLWGSLRLSYLGFIQKVISRKFRSAKNWSKKSFQHPQHLWSICLLFLKCKPCKLEILGWSEGNSFDRNWYCPLTSTKCGMRSSLNQLMNTLL